MAIAERRYIPVKVLLVDDHTLFREGMANLFAANDINVVGMAGNGMEALERARNLRPDVILMDIYMPGCDGIVATRLIKAEMPEVKIVMLTASEEDDNLFDAIKNGACGYLFKKLQSEELLELLAALEKDEPPLAPGLAMKVLKELATRGEQSEEALPAVEESEKLTARQMSILALVAKGHTYRQVAETLCFSERTIKYEIKQILERLQLKSRSEAIAYAAGIGLTGGKTE